MVYQVPLPEPLRWLEPSEQETRTLHALEEYGIMNVKLYEDIVRHGTIATGFDYPVRVAGRYIMSPSPIPRFDNPKMHQCPALQLFGAGREKRLYAIPPYTDVESLDFEDYPFTVQSWDEACAICGRCAILDGKPCRFPEKMHPCVESQGINIIPTLEENGLEFQYGQNVVTWVSLLLYREN